MNITMRLMKIKWAKMLICFLICIATMTLTFYIDYQNVHAILPAVIPLIGFGLVAAAALLVMAGLTFENDYQAEGAAQAWYFDQKRSTQQEIIDGLIDFGELYTNNNTVKIVSDNLWNTIKNWVDTEYNIGENVKNRSIYTVETYEGNTYYYSDDISTPNYNGQVITWFNGDIYEFREYQIIGDRREYHVFINGVDTNNWTVPVKPGTQPHWSIQVENNKFVLCQAYYSYWGSAYSVWNRTTEYSTPEMTVFLQNKRSEAALKPNNMTATGSEAAVDNSAYDFKKETETDRPIALPNTTIVSDILDKTHTDLRTETDTAIAGENPGTGTDITQSWLGGILSSVLTAIAGVPTAINNGLDILGQLLVGTLAQIKASIEAQTAPVVNVITDVGAAIQTKVNSIADSLAGIQENTLEEDVTDNFKQFKLPDLFILSLKVILATIRLGFRALTFTVLLVTIPANSDNIPEDMITSLNFYKNLPIPYINMSLWSLFTILILFGFGISVYKIVVRRVSKK